MNKVILMGRLTRDPEIRSTQSGKLVGSYTIAVDRRVAKADQGTDYIKCQVWEKKAEFAEKYLKKGTKILVTGRIQTGQYKDDNGRTVYTTDVVVEDQEFTESKAAADKVETQAEAAPAPDDGFVDASRLPQSDLPFA